MSTTPAITARNLCKRYSYAKRGRGLAGIAARARQHGGDLAVESAPGAGTALAVSLPARGGA